MVTFCINLLISGKFGSEHNYYMFSLSSFYNMESYKVIITLFEKDSPDNKVIELFDREILSKSFLLQKLG